jgi:uncharacterized protein
MLSDLQKYIETAILPLYERFDRGHNREHVERVIAESLALAADYDVDLDKVYTIAAYHDVGMPRGRDLHHIYSAEILLNDDNLRRWFSEADLRLMADAIEDHRASGKNEPRTIYGRIVAEADRDIDPELILRRTLRFSLRQQPDAAEEWHIQRAIDHLHEKYAEGGYMRLWLHSARNEQGLVALRALIANPEKLRTTLAQLLAEER